MGRLLCKYMSPAGIDMLQNRRLLIGPPIEFNDPFEFYPRVDSDSESYVDELRCVLEQEPRYRQSAFRGLESVPVFASQPAREDFTSCSSIFPNYRNGPPIFGGKPLKSSLGSRSTSCCGRSVGDFHRCNKRGASCACPSTKSRQAGRSTRLPTKKTTRSVEAGQWPGPVRPSLNADYPVELDSPHHRQHILRAPTNADIAFGSFSPSAGGNKAGDGC